MIWRRAPVSVFFLAAALLLAPWSAWLVISLPCRYLSRHWGIAWAGFDGGLALALGLTGFALLRRAPWLDRAAVAAGTLLAADAWFDVVTSRAAAAVAVATLEALAVELPIALLCIWVVRTPVESVANFAPICRRIAQWPGSLQTWRSRPGSARRRSAVS